MPPVAKKIPFQHCLHGHTREDPYHWMRDRENPEVIAHLEAENRHTEESMVPVAGLQEGLFEEIVGRIKKDDESAPVPRDGYYYYSRHEGDREYMIHCRKRGSLAAPEEILLDLNLRAKGHDYYDAGGFSVCPNDRLLAFAEDTVGRNQYTIRIKDLRTGELLGVQIPGAMETTAWAGDGSILFYTLSDPETLRPHRVMRHVLGTDTSGDVEIYREDDETFVCRALRSKSKKYIFVNCRSSLTSEVHFLPADEPLGELRVVQARRRELEYSVAHHEDRFYITTNLDARNFRLMQTPVDRPEMEHWTEVVPHRPDVLLARIDVFRNHLLLSEREAGLARLRVISLADGEEHYVEFPEPTYTVVAGANHDFDTDTVRFFYSSLVTPWSTYDYNMNTRERILRKEQAVLGGYDRGQYESQRMTAQAEDGTAIPLSLVYRRERKKTAGNPLLLYGYGSYGMSSEPVFMSSLISLLDRGFVYAVAHIRGGQEMGREWYDEGKLLRKKNTFTDFIACAEHLVQRGFARTAHLYAMGGSAGGLLVGAVMNMRPDLFAGICAAVPFVDVVTTMLDESLPLTTGEYDEWGNPNEKTYYDYMLSYSPYDNVEAKSYPALLVTTGLHDSQVQYWEPAKWVARLREHKKDDNPLLLFTQMKAGHGGASGRFERHKETALQYAFLLQQEGILE